MQICAAINPVLEKLFPEQSGVKIIAEPGQFFAASSGVILLNIIGKRKVRNDNKETNGMPFFHKQYNI